MRRYIVITAAILSGCGSEEKKNATQTTNATGGTRLGPKDIFKREFERVMAEFNKLTEEEKAKLSSLDCGVNSFGVGRYADDNREQVKEIVVPGIQEFMVVRTVHPAEILRHASRIGFRAAVEGSKLNNRCASFAAPPLAQIYYNIESNKRLCDMISYVSSKKVKTSFIDDFRPLADQNKAFAIAAAVKLIDQVHQLGFAFVGDFTDALHIASPEFVDLVISKAEFTILQVKSSKGLEPDTDQAKADFVSFARSIINTWVRADDSPVKLVVESMIAAPEPDVKAWIDQLSSFSI